MPRLPSTDGVELAVHELGDPGPDAPTILLAHATGFHGLVWAPLVAVVDGLGLHRPLGLGHSAAGAALLLAEIARPGTFEALYCFEPIVLPADPSLGPNPDNPLSRGARRRREVFSSRAEARRNFGSKPPFSALHPDALDAYVDHGFEDRAGGTVRLKCHREDEAEVYAMSSAHAAFPNLASVTCPVHLACGQTTGAITPPVLAPAGGPALPGDDRGPPRPRPLRPAGGPGRRRRLGVRVPVTPRA